MDVLTVARVRRAHGLAGEMLVYAETDDGAEVFQAERRFGVRIERGTETVVREMTLIESRPHRGGYLLRFREVTDRDTAQGLLGAELLLEREDLRPLAEDEYFLHELVGLDVVDERQGSLGPIVDVYDTAGQVLAGVRVDGRERLFPLRREFVRMVDMEARRMEVALPAGLLEL
jgi:16S rRNA processing protein RimM